MILTKENTLHAQVWRNMNGCASNSSKLSLDLSQSIVQYYVPNLKTEYCEWRVQEAHEQVLH